MWLTEEISVLYLKYLSNTSSYLNYTHVYLYLNDANSLSKNKTNVKKIIVHFYFYLKLASKQDRIGLHPSWKTFSGVFNWGHFILVIK